MEKLEKNKMVTRQQKHAVKGLDVDQCRDATNNHRIGFFSLFSIINAIIELVFANKMLNFVFPYV